MFLVSTGSTCWSTARIVGWTTCSSRARTWDRVVTRTSKDVLLLVEAARPMRSRRRLERQRLDVVAARGMRNMTPYAASKAASTRSRSSSPSSSRPTGSASRVRAWSDERGRNLADDPDTPRMGTADPAGPDREPEDMVGPTVFFASDDSRT